MEKQEEIMVTVSMGAYNHEQFVRQALDSVLMQKVNFRYEIIITDDASTDGTADIIREYAAKYPDIIHAVCRKKNIGGRKNSLYRLSHDRGKYHAPLECDDFWTDENKLQKQVDFMEMHPEYSMCFTAANVISDTAKVVPYAQKDMENLEDYLSGGKSIAAIPTATILMRNIYKDHPELLECFKHNRLIGDRIIHTLCFKFGKVKYLPFFSATYRYITKKGSSFSSLSEEVRLRDTVKCYHLCMKISPKKSRASWHKILSGIHNRLLCIIVKEQGLGKGIKYYFQELTLKEKYYLAKEHWK